MIAIVQKFYDIHLEKNLQATSIPFLGPFSRPSLKARLGHAMDTKVRQRYSKGWTLGWHGRALWCLALGMRQFLASNYIPRADTT